MIRKETLRIIIVTLSLLAVVYTASAQQNIGSISGAVYRDANANGLCTDEDELGEAGIPIQLVNRDDDSIVNLTSGSDGSYELIAASSGTWQATVNPGTGWRVTSQQTRQVVIIDTEPDVEEIDFCIVQVSVTGGAGGTGGASGGGSQPVLPESGAALSPALFAAAVLGILFLASGAGLLLHSRKSGNNG